MSIDLEEYALHVQVVRLVGRINAANAPELKEVLKDLTRRQKFNIVLDLRAVDFIDSTGLGILTSVLRASRSGGGDICLVITEASPVLTILSMVRFGEVFTVYPTTQLAISHFITGGE